MKEIKIGMKSEAETIVTKENFAVTVGSGSLEVFATPMMTALMEKAAAATVSECMENDETTVGTMLNITHSSATPEGMKVKAYAKINLALDVVRKREDGYHDLEMIMAPITLHDLIYINTIEEGIEIKNAPSFTEGKTLFIFRQERVSIAYNHVGSMSAGNIFIGGPVATNDELGFCQKTQGKFVRRIFTVGKYDGLGYIVFVYHCMFIIFFHLK